MRRDIRYQYYVEGECEKKLLSELKKTGAVLPGKINVYNITQNELRQEHLRLLARNTVVILIFDTDAGNLSILEKNLSVLRRSPNVRDVWCVTQVRNLEEELVRATDIREIKHLLGCRSNKDFKSVFLSEKRLMDKLFLHNFHFEKMWSSSPSGKYSRIVNDGVKIKQMR